MNGIAPGWFITGVREYTVCDLNMIKVFLQTTSPNTDDSSGVSSLPSTLPAFRIPTRQHNEAGSTGAITNSALLGGTNRDMGALALMLVANWYINGETVLIDGGVSRKFCIILTLAHTMSVHRHCFYIRHHIKEIIGEKKSRNIERT